MALRMTLMEGKGDFNYNRYQENMHIMLSLWEEIADLADFDKARYYKTHIVLATDRHLSFSLGTIQILQQRSRILRILRGSHDRAVTRYSPTVIVAIFLTFQNDLFAAAIHRNLFSSSSFLESTRNVTLVSLANVRLVAFNLN